VVLKGIDGLVKRYKWERQKYYIFVNGYTVEEKRKGITRV